MIPFDTALLDRLMEEAGLDVLLVTSKHNVSYLLGGHRALFFDYMDAMGESRYLPVFIYPKGAREKATYLGHITERHQQQTKKFWLEEVRAVTWGSVDPIERALQVLQDLGLAGGARIGVEYPYLPIDSGRALTAAVPAERIGDALPVLDRLRARKSPRELAMMREASERVIASMGAVVAGMRPGMTKLDIVDALRTEEASRGLVFEYCLVTAGKDLNRAPSAQLCREGDIVSLDSGGSYHGYIGDLARMAIFGEPDAELVDILAEIEAIQQAAIAPIRAGLMGGDIYAAAEAALARVPHDKELHFVAHGVGLVTHEVPRLTSKGPVPYDDGDARRPLEAGMVVSVETTLRASPCGFIKLEDTVAVLDGGHEVFANVARGWNQAGQPVG
jgi:Xaa-Pro aminopeptidase